MASNNYNLTHQELEEVIANAKKQEKKRIYNLAIKMKGTYSESCNCNLIKAITKGGYDGRE